ncbi:MAG: hydantoinase/oxoprolinase family protein [Marinilabilia sp.]
MDQYIIGINTGGTYTDGVLLDYASRRLISSAKSLTTRHDLKIGVIKVLKKLDIKPDYRIKLVGISSTLATNTVAEGKGRKVGLLLAGYDQELVEKYGLSDKLPTDIIGYFAGGHNAQGVEISPLDKEGLEEWVKAHQHEVDAVAISSYFSPMNPAHEDAAFEIIQKHSDLPVVMAHQLSTKLDSIKRAATATINASLVAVMHDFIQSVHQSLEELKINAPLMIVRGDGTLMPSEEAVQKPVETVLSGPAASAIGGRFLAGNGSSLVVDMGSTTTDMAMVHNSTVVVSPEGARVGEIDTAVEAARIRTISLGCDSRIHHNEKKDVVLGPDRVRPLSQLAMYHNNVLEDFRKLNSGNNGVKRPEDIEYWYLHDDIDETTYQTLSDNQKKALEIIRTPTSLSKVVDETGVFHPRNLGLDQLISQGTIECSALTPSDLLHASRSLDLWNKEVANIALDHYCDIFNKAPKMFIEEVFNKITDTLVEEMIIFLACQNTRPSDMPASIDGEWGKWMLQQILYSDNHFLSIDANSRYPVVGVGAPARHFLKRAARNIHAKFNLPEYFEVANAVGAVAGSVAETREAMVFVRDQQDQYTYIARLDGKETEFQDYEECCDFAEESVRNLAKEAAQNAGAIDCFVEMKKKTEGSVRRYVARALGNPKLSRMPKTEETVGNESKVTEKEI